MKILVVGATGMVGSEVVKIAVGKGLTVKALIRKDDSRDKIAEVINKIKCYEGDVLDSDSIASAMDGGVEALVIAIRFDQKEQAMGRSYMTTEAKGVQNLVNASVENGVQKIVYISVDRAGPEAVSERYQAKHQAELCIMDSDINYTIFKPSGMFFDFKNVHIPMVLRLGEVDYWPLGPVDLKMAPISHVDLAKCMVDVLSNPKADNVRLLTGGPETITQGDLLNMIAKKAGINANYTKGASREELIERARQHPEKSFFSPEEIQDFYTEKDGDYSAAQEIFDFPFQRVEDYLNIAVPEVIATFAEKKR